ncbi:hypothetical protein [Spongiactinospora gelatinilytica]|uniref:hypothetical protein n=1 Tax=Spongiactinospora gelatinilytica TaxID=2666298 RepID=UPI0011B940B1|nr:hypothetical protein [Spongiactinospora gelatinilytica]
MATGGDGVARSRGRGGRHRRGRQGGTSARRAVAYVAALGALGVVATGYTLIRGGEAPAVVAAPSGTAAPAVTGGPPHAASAQVPSEAPVFAADAGKTEQKPDDKKSDEKKSDGKRSERKTAERASGPSEHTDTRAVEFLRSKKDSPAKRVTDVRSVGGYLRIYTDLPQSADNSRDALELCQRGLRYLIEEQGVADPIVFVQAEFGENGNPVLANILGSDDANCRVTHPKPAD